MSPVNVSLDGLLYTQHAGVGVKLAVPPKLSIPILMKSGWLVDFHPIKSSAVTLETNWTY